MLKLISRLFSRPPVLGHTPSESQGPKVPRCHLPWQQMIVDAAGTVHPCSFWGTYSNCNDYPSFGNLNEQSIDEIWNNEAYRRLRANMAKGDLEAAGCANCYALKQGLALGFDYDADCEKEGEPRTDYAKNIAQLKKEIAAGASELEARPTIVSYTPSHRCNLRCVQCYQEGTRTAEISRETAADDIARLAPYLVRLIAGGGEPFLLSIWKRFLNEFDVTRNPYLDFGVTTNGTLIDEKVIEGLRRFKTLTLNVSVDATGEVFERVRVGGKWDQVVKNIRTLKQLVEENGSPRSRIGITACVQKSTIRDLPELVRFCTREGIPFGLSPVITMPPDESLVSFNRSPAEEMQGWAEAIEEAKAALDEGYFHVLHRYVKPENRIGDDDVNDFVKKAWRGHFVTLRNEIRWEWAETPHFFARIRVPNEICASFRASYGNNLVAYVFPRSAASGNAPYWAYIKEGDIAELWLPPGEWKLNIADKWHNAGPSDQVVFATAHANEGVINCQIFA